MLEFLTTNQSGIDMLIKIATLLVSVATIVWTVQTGLREFIKARNDKKDTQIADWMKVYTESVDADNKRLSVVSGLSKNCAAVYDELFLLSGSEKNPFIRKLFERALMKHAAKNVSEIVEFNQLYFLCYLELMDTPDVNPESTVIPPAYISEVKKKLLEYRLGTELRHRSAIAHICSTGDAEDVLDYILLSSRIIAASFDKRKGLKIENALLVSHDFYAGQIRGVLFSLCTIPGSILRHAALHKVQFIRCALFGTDFLDCRFFGVRCEKPLWDGVKLIKSRHAGTQFCGGELKACQFDKAQLKDVGFDGVALTDCKFNGAAIRNAVYKNAQWKHCEHRGASYRRVRFSDMKLFENRFVGAVFEQCRFEDVQFYGSEMHGAKFIGCDLRDVDFSGADMKKVRFLHCVFGGEVQFEKAHDISDEAFVRCRGIHIPVVSAPGSDAGVAQ